MLDDGSVRIERSPWFGNLRLRDQMCDTKPSNIGGGGHIIACTVAATYVATAIPSYIPSYSWSGEHRRTAWDR